MAYIIVEPEGQYAGWGRQDNTAKETGDAAAYALAAKYLGMRMVYLEAGSGAETPIPLDMIRAVKYVLGGLSWWLAEESEADLRPLSW